MKCPLSSAEYLAHILLSQSIPWLPAYSVHGCSIILSVQVRFEKGCNVCGSFGEDCVVAILLAAEPISSNHSQITSFDLCVVPYVLINTHKTLLVTTVFFDCHHRYLCQHYSLLLALAHTLTVHFHV